MYYREMLANIEETYRSSDGAVVSQAVLHVEVNAIGSLALDLEGSLGGVVEVLVQQLREAVSIDVQHKKKGTVG